MDKWEEKWGKLEKKREGKEDKKKCGIEKIEKSDEMPSRSHN